MPSKIWTGTLSFVMVSIPVDIVSATRPGKVSYHLMHKEDNSPIQTRMFCPQDKKFVHPEHIVNGYEVDQNKYVIVKEEEYKALEPEKSQTIEINSFIDLKNINPIFFDKNYYILPRKGGAKAYQLLVQVLKDTQKAGISKFVLRSREYLVVVRPHTNILGLMVLHFPEEIRDPREILPQNIKAQPQKIKLISETIKKLKTEYEPDKYEDKYYHKILSYLEKKAKEQGTITIEEPLEEEMPETADTGELVSALEESLAKAKSK
ncbi:MAG: Ku protein [Planctomycetes bacterium GWF2_41_51]|nr:MAG: Ku protein [Planctomycetes bacterium GWF2_41_51]HBG26874.1 Ku protein [Phycisphaerales bacterium]